MITIFDIHFCLDFLNNYKNNYYTYSNNKRVKVNYSHYPSCDIRKIEMFFKCYNMRYFIKNTMYIYRIQSIILLFKKNSLGVTIKSLENCLNFCYNTNLSKTRKIEYSEIDLIRIKTIEENNYYKNKKSKKLNTFTLFNKLDKIKGDY